MASSRRSCAALRSSWLLVNDVMEGSDEIKRDCCRRDSPSSGWVDGVKPVDRRIGIKLLVSCFDFSGSGMVVHERNRYLESKVDEPLNWSAVALSRPSWPTRAASITASVDVTTALHLLHLTISVSDHAVNLQRTSRKVRKTHQ